jgi:hypothetical protein
MDRDSLPSADAPTGAPSRWELIRDLAVFQLKLVIDALRDVALSPISLVAGVFDLVKGADRPGRYFYRVLLAGRRSEAWINLFGEADRVAPRPTDAESASLDALVERVEQRLVEQVERGGVTASAKRAIDRCLDVIARRRTR